MSWKCSVIAVSQTRNSNKSAYIMEKDNMNSEENPNRVRLDHSEKPFPRREPSPDMRFHYGYPSAAEIKAGKNRTPEEILGIPMPKVKAPPREQRPSLPPASSGPQSIEDLPEDCSGDDLPPESELEEMYDGKFLMGWNGGPQVVWGFGDGFIYTECGGHRHEITFYSDGIGVTSHLPEGYTYIRDGIDMNLIFGDLARAVMHVQMEVLAQYRFERNFWPWFIRLPAEDRDLVLSHARYRDRVRLLREKYSISGKPWLARRDPPAAAR
jgi:hypothetical protein